jgi:uncharacterized protein (TIRG00374 family)
MGGSNPGFDGTNLAELEEKQGRKLIPSTEEKTPDNKLHVAPSLLRRWGLGGWQLSIGVLFSLGFLVLALHGVDLRKTISALGRVNVMILVAAVACYVFSVVAKTIRWQLLFAGHKEPSFGRALSILSIGFMVNTFLPARLGEFARAYLMGEAETDSKVYVLGTVAVEKVADLLSLLILLAVLLMEMALPEWLAGPARGTALVLVILIPCFFLMVWKRDFIVQMVQRASRIVPLAWRDWLVRETTHGLASLDVLRSPRLMIGLIGWSLIIWMVSALTNYLVFWALEMVMPVWASLLLLAVLQVGTAVPSSPGRIGVFHYLVILTLAIFSVDKNVALGYSLVLYLVIYVPTALLGIWGLWYEKITWSKLSGALVKFSKGRRSG